MTRSRWSRLGSPSPGAGLLCPLLSNGPSGHSKVMSLGSWQCWWKAWGWKNGTQAPPKALGAGVWSLNKPQEVGTFWLGFCPASGMIHSVVVLLNQKGTSS